MEGQHAYMLVMKKSFFGRLPKMLGVSENALMNSSETFSAFVKRRKLEVRLSFKELAASVGVGHGTVHNWINWNKWKKSCLRELCAALQIEPLTPEALEKQFVIEGWLREDKAEDTPDISKEEDGATAVTPMTGWLAIELNIPPDTPIEEKDRLINGAVALLRSVKSGEKNRRVSWREEP
jgi:hypothetical protein